MDYQKQTDILFLNGKIVTLAESETIATAVAIRDGHIQAVGSDQLLRCSTHAQIVNTCAMNTAKIKVETPDPPGAKIGRNEDTGALKEMVRFHPFSPHSYCEKEQ